MSIFTNFQGLGYFLSPRDEEGCAQSVWTPKARRLRMKVQGGADGQRSCRMNFAAEIDTWRNKVLHSHMASLQTPLGKWKHSDTSCGFVYASHAGPHRLRSGSATDTKPPCLGDDYGKARIITEPFSSWGERLATERAQTLRGVESRWSYVSLLKDETPFSFLVIFPVTNKLFWNEMHWFKLHKHKMC